MTTTEAVGSKSKRPSIRSLGALKDDVEYHGEMLTLKSEILNDIPDTYDLNITFDVYDQGNIGSCTANALAGAIQFDRIKSGQNPPFEPSRLFIYYNERDASGKTAVDSGATLRTGITTLLQIGVCPENDWTYDDTPAGSDDGPFPVGSKPAAKPTPQAYSDASRYKIKNYRKPNQTLNDLRGCLASGLPFVFIFEVYHEWFDPLPALIPLAQSSDHFAGRHAVMCIGYDNTKQLFKIRSSWGSDVGDGGYFYMPYDFILRSDLANDFWVINAVTD